MEKIVADIFKIVNKQAVAIPPKNLEKDYK
jgi:hypothetical protein